MNSNYCIENELVFQSLFCVKSFSPFQIWESKMVEEEEEGGPFCNELMCGEWLHGGGRENHLEITQLFFRL